MSEDNFYQTNLRKIREDKGISLYKVSKDISINWDILNKFEENRYKLLPADVLSKLCNYFNIDIGDLIVINPQKKTIKLA